MSVCGELELSSLKVVEAAGERGRVTSRGPVWTQACTAAKVPLGSYLGAARVHWHQG